jgi:signal transduction histidine kinase
MVFELKLGRAGKIALTFLLAAPIVMMALPAPMNRFGLYLNAVPVLFTAVSAARALSAERVRDKPYLALLLAAVLCHSIWGVITNNPVRAYFFAPFTLSNTFVMLCQFMRLSRGYADARRKAKELAAKNDFYHRVAHDLLTPLTKVSTNVQVANMKPETDHERLAKSQAEIMKMAGMINRALAEGRDTEGGGG